MSGELPQHGIPTAKPVPLGVACLRCNQPSPGKHRPQERGAGTSLKLSLGVTSRDMDPASLLRGYFCLKAAGYIHGFSGSHMWIHVLGFHWSVARSAVLPLMHFGYHLKRDQEPDTTIFCAFTILFLPSAKFTNASWDFFLQSIWDVINKPKFKDDIYCFESNAYLETDSLSSDTASTPDGSTSKLKAYSPEYNFKSRYFNS